MYDIMGDSSTKFVSLQGLGKFLEILPSHLIGNDFVKKDTSTLDNYYTKGQLDDRFTTVSNSVTDIQNVIPDDTSAGTNLLVNHRELNSNIESVIDDIAFVPGIGAHSAILRDSSCDATGELSVAEGQNTNATGDYSHAEGYYTETNNQGEHAQGQYNVSTKTSETFGAPGNTIHSIGIGESIDARSNAIEVMQDGSVYVYGIGGYSGNNAATGAFTLQNVISGHSSMKIAMYAANSGAPTTFWAKPSDLDLHKNVFYIMQEGGEFTNMGECTNSYYEPDDCFEIGFKYTDGTHMSKNVMFFYNI